MTNTARLVLTFLAVVVSVLAAADPFGLPTWVQVVAVALAAGFAAIGIPAGSLVPGDRTRTINRH